MISFWFNSLTGRLSLMATLVLLVFLLLLSSVLERAFRTSLLEAKERELQLHVYTLLAVAEPEGNGLQFPEQLPEQRFNQPASGLVGAVANAEGEVIWRSGSAITLRPFPVRPLPQGERAFALFTGSVSGIEFSSFRQGVAWGLDDEQQFTFLVLEDAAPLRAQVRHFRETLWGWLALGSLALILMQWLVLRWGLAPLRRVTRELQKMQRGGSDRLEGKFPRELVPLTDNLNLLVENERRQREKTRHTLADLAHSLKTPLAVLKGTDLSADPEGTKRILADQVQRMDSIISYQLSRAVAGSPKSILRGVPVMPLVQKILDALDKVYRSKPTAVDLQCSDEALFYGDEGDLMELLGNLLDNGYKYGGGRLAVNIRNGSDGRSLDIRVADNGPGISEERWQQVIQRGVRADQQQPGQGIGLAVVVDIVHSYKGNISVAQSPEGGAEIRVTL